VATLAFAIGGLATAEVALRIVGLGHPILYDNRASYGYRPVPGQTQRRVLGARVHVNQLGVRGPEVSPGALRILFLGDSVTWGGSYVDDADLFAAIAARAVAERFPGRFPAVVPLDAGVNGWGPQNVLALLQEGDAFASPLWVLTLLDDDFRRQKTRIGEVPYFNVPPATALEELLVLGGYRLLTAYKVPKPAADLERIAADDFAACGAIFRLAADRGARLLVVWHPSAPALAGEAEIYRDRLGEQAAAAGIPVLDLREAYRGHEKLYVDAIHLSTAGHRVAGAAIGGRLSAMLAGH
jgi:hypothetical protein